MKSNIEMSFSCDKGFNLEKSTENYKFCNFCNKKIYDFRDLTPLEIEKFLKNTNQQICAKVEYYQLKNPFNNWRDSIVHVFQKFKYSKNRLIIHKSITVLLFGLLILTGCQRNRPTAPGYIKISK